MSGATGQPTTTAGQRRSLTPTTHGDPDGDCAAEPVAGPVAGPAGSDVAGSRPVVSDTVRQLLRSAVALQAEDLLRTIGALALEQRDVREWTAMVERDVRDLAFLSSCAVAAGARLPAGLDGGGGDPERPGSVIEGLLASHEALMDVLGQVSTRCSDPRISSTARAVLDRREEEATVLRALGAGAGLPDQVRFVQGALPKYQA